MIEQNPYRGSIVSSKYVDPVYGLRESVGGEEFRQL
jgi:hypothetical protein